MLKRHGWWLTAVPVLAGHWLVLQGLQGLDDRDAASQTRAGLVFQTRSIVPPTSPVVAAESPASSSPPSPPAPPRRKAKAAVPKAPLPSASPATSPSPLPWTPPETTTEASAAIQETPTSDGTDPARPDATDSAPTSVPDSAPALNPLTLALSVVRPGAAATEDDGPVGQALPPVQLPPPTVLKFDVTGQARLLHYRARAELTWQHDGARYQAQQSISALFVGSRIQRSTGRVSAQGLLPERFSDKSRSEQAAHFDPAEGKVTFSANTPDAAIGAGTQDRLSVFIQVGGLLAAAPERYPTGTQIQLTTVSARAADRWTFTLEAPETLELPAGTIPAIKLLRLPRRDYDQKAELWLAPSLGYLPARIRLTQSNGDFADLQLESHHSP